MSNIPLFLIHFELELEISLNIPRLINLLQYSTSPPQKRL